METLFLDWKRGNRDEIQAYFRVKLSGIKGGNILTVLLRTLSYEYKTQSDKCYHGFYVALEWACLHSVLREAENELWVWLVPCFCCGK